MLEFVLGRVVLVVHSGFSVVSDGGVSLPCDFDVNDVVITCKNIMVCGVLFVCRILVYR